MPSPTGRRLRIGIGGMAIESSQFCPHRSTYDDFRVTRGAELLARYTWTAPDSDLAGRVVWVPLVHAVSMPGGPVERAAYDRIKTELTARTAESGPLDGLVYDIHGAMSVIGLDDAEADLTDAVRKATGPGTLISAAMDLHGNVSRRFADRLDLLTAHRLAPHEDAWDTRERAARNLVERLASGKGRPHRAWVQVPVLLPGEKTSTRLEPAKSLYGRLASVEALDGVVDAAIWVGYAWADEERCRAAVVVTADDPELAVAQAGSLAQEYWDVRRDFAFVGPTGDADTCIARAVASSARPFLISDSGDNPTAGGAGDLAYMLGRLLAHEDLASGRVTALHPGITDPQAVAACFAAGTGAEVTLTVGGHVSEGTGPHAAPYTLTGIVTDLGGEETTGVTTGPVEQEGTPVPGNPAYDDGGGRTAAVTSGGVTVVLTERRKSFHTRADFGALDPLVHDLVVVKIGYLEPELYAMAADWLLALTPGGVDQDLLRLGHHKVRRPLYPFDNAGFEDPDLTPELL
ncbi:M81 family metallopeptidase [Streptomyces pinistramenti]|uniref:M81 family metallopeptidase n=1 Tax=Streptomyces pinistramenti TaxID=2884812 RepID=UPI001D07FDAE|nr:M81 family metallopeptidase [Streptomyces pinistramenti]MCB5912219.1 M81 family metallopeptidase [Streptomyces pinistramenti]